MTVLVAKFPPAVPKLIRLLDSDSDSECIAAARTLGRALRAAGTDFHGLAELVDQRGGHRVHHRDPDAGDWRALARWCLAQEARLNDWEADFVAGVVDWIGRPTHKQLDRLGVIAAKTRRNA
jgi:hypothetical protein